MKTLQAMWKLSVIFTPIEIVARSFFLTYFGYFFMAYPPFIWGEDILTVKTILLAAMVVFCWSTHWIVGHCIQKRKGHLFIQIVAFITFFFSIFHAALAAFTYVLLLRPSVKAEFNSKETVEA